ncbi:MAG TPA: group 1 truncated hemoglobin [Burkholderiaceae bacterium]|jgi:hemoglobin
MFKQLMRIALLAACVAIAACAAAPSGTLYERLGGEPVVFEVTGKTLERAAHDPRTMRSFDGIKLTTLHKSLAQHICAISDGGCRYEGDTMEKAHHDLKIQPSEYDAMVDILREELDAAHVNVGAKNELLKLMAPMKRDIVAHP